MIAGLIAQLLAGRATSRVRAAVQPNPYAPDLPMQTAQATRQLGYGLRPGTSGLAGSERDYYTDSQGVSTIGTLAIVQDVTSRAMPPSTYVAGDPGADPNDPTVLRDFYRGPNGNPTTWGVNTRGVPIAYTARIDPPTASTPRPRAVVAGRVQAVPAAAVDPFDTAFSS